MHYWNILPVKFYPKKNAIYFPAVLQCTDGNITILMEKSFQAVLSYSRIKGGNEGAEQICMYEQKHKTNLNITVHRKIFKLYLAFLRMTSDGTDSHEKPARNMCSSTGEKKSGQLTRRKELTG